VLRSGLVSANHTPRDLGHEPTVKRKDEAVRPLAYA
jgi:hypothetical protein